MAAEIRVPEMGESVVSATVGRWLKQPGDAVQRGEVLLELETEKVNLEIAAETDGVLSSVLHPEGDEVSVGDVLATIEAGAAAPVAAPPQAAPAPAPAKAAPETTARVEPAAAPTARRLAEEHDIDLATIQGSGKGGAVTRDDVTRAIEDRRTAETAPAPAPATPVPAAPSPAAPAVPAASQPGPAAAGPREERSRMSRRRQTIARRLVEAQRTAAMLTTFNEIDMSTVMDLRKRLKEPFQARHGVGLGFMSFFTKAVVGALKEFPLLNAEIDGDDLVVKHYYNIGVAIGAPQGLVVPVLRDADRMSFADIERAIGELSVKARDNKLALEDLTGGTFTITNGGVFGSLMSTPILNTPEVGILGMHKIQDRPVVVNGAVVVRPMMYVALSYDHRIVDGREAVQFLVRIKQLIEEPGDLLVNS